jgi:hypothetical protein
MVDEIQGNIYAGFPKLRPMSSITSDLISNFEAIPKRHNAAIEILKMEIDELRVTLSAKHLELEWQAKDLNAQIADTLEPGMAMEHQISGRATESATCGWRTTPVSEERAADRIGSTKNEKLQMQPSRGDRRGFHRRRGRKPGPGRGVKAEAAVRRISSVEAAAAAQPQADDAGGFRTF